jgi:hypothetical protein
VLDHGHVASMLETTHIAPVVRVLHLGLDRKLQCLDNETYLIRYLKRC